MRRLALLVLLCLVTGGCGDAAQEDGTFEYGLDADLADFDAFTGVADLDLGEGDRAAPWTYLALYFGGGDAPEIVAAAGESCGAATDLAACEAALAAVDEPDGFTNECIPARCYKYLVVNVGDEVRTITTDNGLREFLGSIDSFVEALLVMEANDYFVATQDKGDGALRRVDEGFEFIATRLTNACQPISVERRRVLVPADGTIEVLESEVAFHDSEACI